MSKVKKLEPKIILFGVCYLVAEILGIVTFTESLNNLTTWFANGVLISFLLFADKNEQRRLLIAAFVINSIAPLVTSKNFILLFLLSNVNLLGTFVVVWASSKYFRSYAFFNDLKSILSFSIAVFIVLSPVNNLLSAATLSSFASPFSFSTLLFLPWLSQSLAILISVVLILSAANLKKQNMFLKSKKDASLFVLSIILLLAAFVVFYSHKDLNWPLAAFVISVSLIWASVRFGLIGASSFMLIVSIAAVSYAHSNYQLQGDFFDTIFSFHIILLISTITSFVIAALSTHQKKIETELKMEAEELKVLRAQISDGASATRKIEDELHESEEKFKTIVKESPVGIFQFDGECKLREFNKEFANIFRLRERKSQQYDLKKLFASKYRYILDDVLSGRDTFYEGNSPMLSSPFKKSVSIKITPLYDDKKNVAGGIGIVEDITVSKNIVDELKRSEERYRMLVDQAKSGIFLSGPDGKLHDVNIAGCNLLGYEKHELLGQEIADFTVDEDAGQSGILPSFKNDLYSEMFFKKKDGSVIACELLSQTLTDNRHLVILQDITARKEAEKKIARTLEELHFNKDLLEGRTVELFLLSERLAKSEAELKKINAQKDKFFSMFAHDLKSPMSGLLGYSNLLLDDFDTMNTPDIKEFATIMNRQIKNVFKFLEKLLDWSRLQMGRMEFKPEKIDVYESIIYSLNLLTANANNKSVHINLDIEPGQYAFADERMLNSIIENLLSNAIKFTARGGSVSVSSVSREHYWKVSVTDTGVGMERDELENIFRIDKTHTKPGTEQEKGTGLGLILCKEMIEKQGGTISLESKINSGTTISFTIPKWEELTYVSEACAVKDEGQINER